jgi:hypothetical protein
LTEGQGMVRFTAAEAARWVCTAIGRRVDVVVFNTGRPAPEALARYEVEHKTPLPLGDLPDGVDLVEGDFWGSDIARHNRRRLSYALWSVLAGRLLT